MSADNWAECPRCLATAAKTRNDAIEAARASYGKVPAGEYHRALTAANALPHADALDSTLREDYSVGIYPDGLFRVAYSASCSECGFSFRFEEAKAAGDG